MRRRRRKKHGQPALVLAAALLISGALALIIAVPENGVPEAEPSSMVASRDEYSALVSSISDPDEKPGSLFHPVYETLSFEEKLEVLEDYFPDGSYWNHCGRDISLMTEDEAAMVTTDSACIHSANGYGCCNIYNGETLSWFPYTYNTQCLGFASLVSDFLFGRDAQIHEVSGYDQLQPGDHIRFTELTHSVIVLEKTEDYVTVLECNSDYENCRVEWGRIITREELETEQTLCLSRYPEV